MRDSFIFYKSFYESVKELDSNIQWEVYNAIMEYEFGKNDVELSGVAKAIFTLIKPQLEANDKKYENGCKGGRPKTKTKPKQNLNKTKPKPNDNENDNDNENVIKENTKRKVFKKPTLEEVEEYCKQRNSSVDAKTFYEYFEAGGWIDSKGNKVKNWKQKVITWENSRKSKEEKTPDWFDKEQDIKIMSKQEEDEISHILEGMI